MPVEPGEGGGGTPAPPPQGRSQGDPAGTLAPSLRRLFGEIDARWPLRDRRTDGWYRAPRIGTSYGHNPDARGRVHAIDVDRDGINPDWIIRTINRATSGLWYIIWHDRLWSMDHRWQPYDYHGASRHRDHMHIEIRHTNAAWNFGGAWGIAPVPIGAPGPAAPGANQWGEADYLGEITESADMILGAGDRAYAYGTAIAELRI